jgi:hypothetical protein
MNDATSITIYRPPERMTINQVILAWLDEKRADSMRTSDAYDETLHDFRSTLQSAGLDLDSEPALVAPLAQGWARSSRREGVTVTATTFNQHRQSRVSALIVPRPRACGITLC